MWSVSIARVWTLVKHLSGIADAEIAGLEIPTGQPLVYELDESLNEVERYYLKDR